LSALPSPEEFETLAMPSQDCGRLHHDKTFSPANPEAGEQHPECTVNGSKAGPRSSLNEARELVTQGNILGDEICAILENGGDNGENQWELEGHPPECSLSRIERKNQQFRYRVQ
jgi:hypothetical protein